MPEFLDKPSLSSSLPRIYPVLLSGGSGTRLWPMSRERYPKQLLQLVSPERSMLQETVSRVADSARFMPPLVICNEQHRFVIAEQLREIAMAPAGIILEPVARNTAPAAAVAALQIAETDPDGLMLILPADHLIRDLPAFAEAIGRAAEAAARDGLVTFGIVPSAPETGYGYIERGTALSGLMGVFRVSAFVEKPDRGRAEKFLAGGVHFWNSGMFLFPVRRYIEELRRFEPGILAAAAAALAGASRDLDFVRLDSAAFGEARNLSIDYAVMERTDNAVVVPAELGWTDVGAWSALWDVGEKDADGNVLIGDALSEQSKNCYIRSETVLTTVLGLENAVVVVTDDAVLVAAKDKVQEVKAIVERLKRAGREEPLDHRRVHRPWGFYQHLHSGDRFQVKRLTVAPGCKLSLQKHFHRAEHWVVVNGTALVRRGEEEILLRENESIYLPAGAVHRLENPGKLPLNVIEVQSGAYLGEDDIVRIEDTYGRA